MNINRGLDTAIGIGTFLTVKKNQIFTDTHSISPKGVTSGGVHLHCLTPGQHSSEETSQRRRAVGDTISD